MSPSSAVIIILSLIFSEISHVECLKQRALRLRPPILACPSLVRLTIHYYPLLSPASDIEPVVERQLRAGAG